MALYLALNQDASGVVSEQNPIQTKHSSEGEPVVVPVYLFNDGKRKNVANDTNPPPLIYTNLRLQIEGVAYVLQQNLQSTISDVNVVCDSVNGWNIGTIIRSGVERMRVEQVISASTVRVQRNYTADGGTSSISSHSVGSVLTAETVSVALALPNPSNTDYSNPGTFQSGGVSITSGIDPTILTQALGSLETQNIVKSNNGTRYHVGSIIKIGNEEMKVLAISGNDVQVLRGYNGTTRTTHSLNAVIHCVGIVDISPITHKFFIRNDPPAGLPTQKKRDIRISIVADEEPL